MRDVVPGEPMLSRLYLSVADGQMPLAPNPKLSSQEIQDIYNWIQDGFTEVPTNIDVGGQVNSLPATFTAINREILQRKCASCHNNTNRSGNVSFASYQLTMGTVVAGNAATSRLYLSTTGTGGGRRMPPAPQAALSQAELSAIQTWINAGAMNN
jgi:uncharacterized membrane protein